MRLAGQNKYEISNHECHYSEVNIQAKQNIIQQQRKELSLPVYILWNAALSEWVFSLFLKHSYIVSLHDGEDEMYNSSSGTWTTTERQWTARPGMSSELVYQH